MRLLCIDTCLDACSVGVFRAGAPLHCDQRPMTRGHAEVLGPMTQQALAATGLEVADLDRIAVTIGPGSFTGVRVGIAFARGLAIGQKASLVGIGTLEVLANGMLEIAARRRADRALSCAAPRAAPCAAFIDARRGEVYGQVFAATRAPLCEPFALAPREAAQKLAHLLGDALPERPGVMLCGNGAALVGAARVPHDGAVPGGGWFVSNPGAKHPNEAGYPDDAGMAGPDPAVSDPETLDLEVLGRLATHRSQHLAARPLYVRAADAKKPAFASKKRPF